MEISMNENQTKALAKISQGADTVSKLAKALGRVYSTANGIAIALHQAGLITFYKPDLEAKHNQGRRGRKSLSVGLTPEGKAMLRKLAKG